MNSAYWTQRVDRRTALAALGAAGAGLLGDPLMPMNANPSVDDPRDNASRRALGSLSSASQERLRRLISARDFAGQIRAVEVRGLTEAEGKTVEAVMIALLPLAQTYSRPPVSNFRVGAVVHGASGNLYLGANLEIAGQALDFSVHAEQAALSNAYMHDEQSVSSIAVTAAPCGHCRQFMIELSPEGEIQVLVAGKPPMKLSTLLPMAFGPRDLGLERGAFPVKEASLSVRERTPDPLTAAALAAARRSWAPYTKAYSGVAIGTSDGEIYPGAYIENAAFNPSLPPFETALVALVLGGEAAPAIDRVVLVEVEDAPISHRSVTEAALSVLAPAAKLRVVSARMKRDS